MGEKLRETPEYLKALSVQNKKENCQYPSHNQGIINLKELNFSDVETAIAYYFPSKESK